MDSYSNSRNPNKHLKEQFVSGLTGTSMLEINVLLTLVPILFLLRHSISTYRGSDRNAKHKPLKKSDATITSKSWLDFVGTISLDFLLIVLPMLLFFTVLAEQTYLWLILLAVLTFFIAVKRSPAYMEEHSHSFTKEISSYRVALMIITCLCILAVDFRIFPRKHAKTETYGTSLMDLGVGSFVLANSIVSRQARGVLLMNRLAALKATSPLLLLGFGRLVSTRGLDYQIHVGEYGVHWNFFFTLAAISVLTSLVNIPAQYSGIVGSIVLIGYQSWLNHGLSMYLISNERGADIISKNKEGVYSIFGYFGMYLIGVHLGYYIFFENRSSAGPRRNKQAIIRVFLLSLLFWLLSVLLDNFVERISRRTCNMAFVFWVLAQNLQLLGIFMLSDFIPGSKTSVLEEAFDRNLLALFLLANILTGLVNLSVDTIFASSVSALLILVAYAFTQSVVIGTVHFFGIRLKCW